MKKDCKEDIRESCLVRQDGNTWPSEFPISFYRLSIRLSLAVNPRYFESRIFTFYSIISFVLIQRSKNQDSSNPVISSQYNMSSRTSVRDLVVKPGKTKA